MKIKALIGIGGISLWLLFLGFGLTPSVQGQLTSIDSLRPLYRIFRNSVFNIVGRTDSDWAYKWNLQRGVKICNVPLRIVLIFLSIAESSNPFPQRPKILLRSIGTRSPKSPSPWFGAQTSTGWYRCGWWNRGFSDGRQWSLGHEYSASYDREQRGFMVDRWPSNVAQVFDAAEYAEGVQSESVRIFHDRWVFNVKNGEVSQWIFNFFLWKIKKNNWRDLFVRKYGKFPLLCSNS